VLTIAKLGAGQESYYLSKVARGIEDYYSGDGEAPGVWMGRGAERLGLAGEVPGSALRAGLAGRNPLTDAQLAGTPGARRVPGWDLTFCAPKSVSVLYALGDRTTSGAVVEAHETAVAQAVAYLERHATVSRRRIGGVVHQVVGEGLTIAAFRHRTSRAGDPHLHTHALALNLVERVQGGWGAVHSPVLYRHARTAGFVYQAVLRSELAERLGVAWEPVRNGHAEISGVDARLLRAFSKRHAEIVDELGELGDHSARETEIAQRRTKAPKLGIDGSRLHQGWHDEAASVGVEPTRVARSVTGHSAPSASEAQLDWIVDDLVSAEGLTAHQATFDRRDVIRAWCENLPAGSRVSLDALELLADEAIADPRVVPVVAQPVERSTSVLRADGSATTVAPDRRRWSTEEMLAVEQRLVDQAFAGLGAGAGRVEASHARNYLDARRDLTVEQRDMVATITTSGNGVDVVVGRAGTGKTYALAAAAALWRADGLRPIGVALAARAATELESSAGIASTTTARFLMDIDQAPIDSLTDRHVVVVDEAGMVDTRRLGRILRRADAVGAKVVLVGDHRQLPAVEAGGAFAALVTRLPTVELTENKRQVFEWERETLDRMRDGTTNELASLMATYGDHGRLHFGETPADVRTAMVSDWYSATQAGSRAAMVALRRSDVDALNSLARGLLVADGHVEADGVSIDGRVFAVGDTVVCLNNDRRVGVHNAMFGTVIAGDSASGSLTIEVDRDGRHVVIPADYSRAGHLSHGYAMTVHKSQGATFDRALLLGDDRLYRQAGYTALSRGRQRNDVYLVVDDDREHDPELARHGQAPPDEPVARAVRALTRDGAKVMALDEREPVDGRRWPSLAELWVERDAHAGLGTGDHRIEELDEAIAVRIRFAGRAAEIERPPALVDRLGEPPTSLHQRDLWRAAAGAIQSYEARWGISHSAAMPVDAPIEQLDSWSSVDDAIRSSFEESAVESVALS
jgi:conjugative relaxase-like TrwC/TraI family protein